MKSAKTILTAMGLFILFSWQNGQFVFSQAHEEKFTMIKDQLLGNEVMIDFSLFVGAEGKEREMLDSFRKEGRNNMMPRCTIHRELPGIRTLFYPILCSLLTGHFTSMAEVSGVSSSQGAGNLSWRKEL